VAGARRRGLQAHYEWMPVRVVDAAIRAGTIAASPTATWST
jgi:hypothetical protein